MQICIIEDNYFTRFEPRIFSSPVYDLVCGVTSIKTKILRAYKGIKYSLLTRKHLAQILKSRNPYLNKKLSGYLSHSYLGSWINLGANTNYSDSKNNYGTIKIHVEGGRGGYRYSVFRFNFGGSFQIRNQYNV